MKTETFFTDHSLAINGFHYNYRVIDCACENKRQRCPIVLISGAFQDKCSWNRYVKVLFSSNPIIIIDLPGSGNSDLLPSTFNLDFLVKALLNVLNNFKYPRFIITGVSYGTPIAYSFAKKYPEKVSHLLLFGTMKKIPDESILSTIHCIELLSQNNMHEFAMQALEILTYRKNPEEINNFKLTERLLYSGLVNMDQHCKANFIENTFRLLHHKPLDISKRFSVNTLVVTGEKDVYTKPEYCEEIAQSIKGSTFVTIKNADHLFHLQQFDSTLEILQKFINDEPLEGIKDINTLKYFN